MSAQLASSNSFSAHLALPAGVSVTINAPTLPELAVVVGKLTEAANTAQIAGEAQQPRAAKAKPEQTTAAPEQTAGNATAPTTSTATPASAQPAASGSAAGGEAPAITYDQVRAKVLALSKIGREPAVNTLGKFTGVNGQPVDHATKLQLQDYAAFIAAADAVIAAAGAAK